MAQKQIAIENVGLVTFQKRKGVRNIRLTISHEGQLRVSLPSWSPYRIGEAFVRSRAEWILEQQASKKQLLLEDGHRIGKAHRIIFINEDRKTVTSRVSANKIVVRLPIGLGYDDPKSQAGLRSAAVRALKQEAKLLLPQRLKFLATEYGFSYRSVAIKQLKSRWGSCSSNKEIALNCFLMQLPWELIDYVLMHELLHTRIMAHGERFWSELSLYVNNLPAKRKSIKAHHPSVLSQD